MKPMNKPWSISPRYLTTKLGSYRTIDLILVPAIEARCLIRPLAYNFCSYIRLAAAFDYGSKFSSKLELLLSEVRVSSGLFMNELVSAFTVLLTNVELIP